jgi:hypothetical protein
MRDALGPLSLPPLPESLYPARLEQTVIAEWQPFQELAARQRRTPRARSRPRLAVSHKSMGLAFAVVLIGTFALSREATREAIRTPQVTIRKALQHRAALEISDNFRMNAAQWRMSGSGWKRDREGFIRPGSLALFRPSLGFADYRLEFLAQIESKSVGWVFRARDEKNYYAMKVTVLEPGPRPIVGVERYPVIDGHRHKPVRAPIPVMFHNNVPYRVQVEVRGNRFTTMLEGQVVDRWTDDRIHTGGVGFFNDAGEVARLYWMKISQNTDLLGRICALIARHSGSTSGLPEQAALPHAAWGEAKSRHGRSGRQARLRYAARWGAATGA